MIRKFIGRIKDFYNTYEPKIALFVNSDFRFDLLFYLSIKEPNVAYTLTYKVRRLHLRVCLYLVDTSAPNQSRERP